MKLKLLAWAVLLAAGSAYAAPTLQTCAPMEVAHNGEAGLSYTLACDAGGWSLKYVGSLPAGTNTVLARYRVQVQNPDGVNFTQNREVRLPSPAMLGQALMREAVLLDSGDLALRDCPEFNCTLYRPLGSAAKLAKASVTVTPEAKRLTDEASRMAGELGKRQADLAAQGEKVAGLEREVASLSAKLQEAERSITNARNEVSAVKEQRDADLAGLLNSSKEELAKTQGAMAAQADAKISTLAGQLQATVTDLDKVRKELAASAAAQASAESARNRAVEDVAARTKQVEDLQAQLKTTNAWLASAREGYDTKVAALNTTQEKSSATNAEMTALKLQLDAANSKLSKVASNADSLERALTEARGKLALALKDRDYRETKVVTAVGSKEKRRLELEKALSAAQSQVAELTSARSKQIADLQDALAAANKKLVEVQAQFDKQVMSLDTAHGQQADLVAAESNLAKATRQVEQLTQKVATLEQSLSVANTALETVQKAQDLSALDASGLQAALAKAKKEFSDSAAAHESETAELRSQLTQRLSDRDAAEAKVKQLQRELDDQAVKLLQADTARLDALKGTKQLAENMLEALDAFQDLQREKAEADKALTSSTNKVMEQAAKLEAANLARGLAMQAATAANADADTQHIKNQELAQKLAGAEASLTTVIAQRDSLVAKLQATQAELKSAATTKHSAGADVDSLKSMVEFLTQDRDQFQRQVETQTVRIAELEFANRSQAEEIAALRLELAALKGTSFLLPTLPVVFPTTPPVVDPLDSAK